MGVDREEHRIVAVAVEEEGERRIALLHLEVHLHHLVVLLHHLVVLLLILMRDPLCVDYYMCMVIDACIKRGVEHSYFDRSDG